MLITFFDRVFQVFHDVQVAVVFRPANNNSGFRVERELDGSHRRTRDRSVRVEPELYVVRQ